MPSTVRIAIQRPALRAVGEAVAPPRRQRNSERRPREYLTPAEVEKLWSAILPASVELVEPLRRAAIEGVLLGL